MEMMVSCGPNMVSLGVSSKNKTISRSLVTTFLYLALWFKLVSYISLQVL